MTADPAVAEVPERRSARRAAVALAGFVVLAILLARTLAAVALPGLNSDSLFVPDLTEDLARNGLDVAWQLSATPYLVPDVAVFAVLRLVSSDLLATFVAAFAVHLLAVGAGTYLLLRTVGAGANRPGARPAVSPVHAALLAAGSLTATLALVVALLPHDAADYVFFPGIHRGAISAGLLFLAFAARRFAGCARRFERAVAACGVTLVTFSDPAFAAWFVLPAGLVALVRRAQHPQGVRGAVRDVFPDGAAIAAAVFARWALDGTAKFDVHQQPVATEFATWLESARACLRDLPHSAAWLCAVAAAIATVGALRARGTLARPMPPAAHLLLAVAPVVLVLPWATGLWKDPASARFFLPLVFVAAPILAVAAVAATGPRVRRAVLVVFAIAGIGVLVARGATPPLRLPPCGLAEELDRLNASGEVSHGLAEYWNARLVRMRSGTGVRIQPLATRGDPNLWAENLDRFLDREMGAARRPEVRFIVVDDLDRDAIAARFGESREVRRVVWTRQRRARESEIWLYPAPGPPARTGALLDALRAESDRIGLRSRER